MVSTIAPEIIEIIPCFGFFLLIVECPKFFQQSAKFFVFFF
jgi:hypothetical protein